MTLKVRLAAMMILLIVAVLALQFLLTAREQRELAERIARISDEINLTAAQATTYAFDLAHDPDARIADLQTDDVLARRFRGRTEVRFFRAGSDDATFVSRDVQEVSSTVWNHDTDVWIDSLATALDPGSLRVDSLDGGREIVILAEFTGDSTGAHVQDFFRDHEKHRQTLFGDSTRRGTLQLRHTWTGPGPVSDHMVFQLPLALPTRDSLHVVELRYPLAELTEALADARRRSLIWMTSLLGIGALGAALLAIQFTSPIRKLERSFKRVEEGDLDVRVEAPRKDEIGKLTTSFNHMVDRLRDTRSMEQRLQETERLAAMGRLAAGVAHEVRNPLNAIQLNLAQLHDKAAPATGDPHRADFDRYLATVTGEIGRLEHLVSAFLDLSRSEAMEQGPVDLVASIETAVALFEAHATDRDVRLEREIADGLVVDGDAGRLATVWNNLLSNALSATARGGTVSITTTPIVGPDARPGVEIVVADDGAGMTPEQLARAWDPFYSEKDGGTGLGLSIVRTVIERHGGTATLSSEAGRGTAVRVWLPVIDDPPSQES